MNIRKPIIENTVYSDILFRLGVHKFYVNQFVDHFVENDMANEKPYKEQSVLQRQMEYLRKEGYLLTTNFDSSGRKADKNKKLFYINFKKIIDVFLDYSSSMLKDRLRNGEISKQEYDSRTKEIKSISFRGKAKNNLIIKYLFSAYIEEIRHCNYNFKELTLREVFDSILSIPYVEEKLKYSILDLSDKKRTVKTDIDILKLIKKQYVQDYKFFMHFLSVIVINRGLRHYIGDLFPVEISGKLVNGFDKRDYSFYRLEE